MDEEILSGFWRRNIKGFKRYVLKLRQEISSLIQTLYGYANVYVVLVVTKSCENNTVQPAA